MFKPYQTLDL